MRFLLVLALLVFSASTCAGQRRITIFLAGDSTMADKPSVRRPETGWGEKLQEHFDENRVLIINRAQNGKSSRTFVEQGFWKMILDSLREGDFVFIQFGHNDEAKNSPDRYVTPEDFGRNLSRFAEQVRNKKAVPVLLTPVMRRLFDDKGNFYDTHGEYPDVVRSVARETNILLIDMQWLSERIVKNLGPEESKKLFLQLKPGNHPNFPKGADDNTHFSDLGAEQMAEAVAENIRDRKLKLAKYLKSSGAKKN
jgi:lysophospholipase L1-like esterase